MAEGMMGRGPAPRGRLSDEQRARIREVRESQGRGAARAMRRDLRREAGLPVRQRQNQMSEMAPPAQQSPMVMGQPTEDMMAFRPMPTEQPSMAPMSPGFGPGAAQDIGAALGDLQQRPLPITDMMYRPSIHGTPGEMQTMTPEQVQAIRDQYTQMQGQPMPGMNPNFGPMPSLQMPMQQPMQQEPGYYPAIRNMMNTGRMDANHPMAQTVGAYDRQKAMQMFGQKQAQNAMNPGFNPSLAGAKFY